MKFTEGYWLRSERANGLFAAEGYTVDRIPGGMRVVAPVGKINGRGDTLNMPTITVEFKACAAGTISVKAWHYEGYDNHLPQYEKNETMIEPEVTDHRGGSSSGYRRAEGTCGPKKLQLFI